MNQSELVPPPDVYVGPTTLPDIHTFLTTVLERTLPPANGAICAICMLSWEHENGHAVKTPCGHIYHFDCIAQWLHPRRSDHGPASWFSACPMDRINLCYNSWGSIWTLRFRDADQSLPQLVSDASRIVAPTFKKSLFVKPEDLFWRAVKPCFRSVIAGWRLNKTSLEWDRTDRSWLSDAAVVQLTVNMLATQFASANRISMQEWINLTHLRDWYIVDKYDPDAPDGVDVYVFSPAENIYIRNNPMRYRFRPEDVFGRGTPRTISLLVGALGTGGIGPVTHTDHIDSAPYSKAPRNWIFPLYEVEEDEWSLNACFFYLLMGREDNAENESGKESGRAPDYVELVYGGHGHMFSADWDLDNATLTLTQSKRETTPVQMEVKFVFQSAPTSPCQHCRDNRIHESATV